MKKIISLGMILILMLFAGQAFAQSARLNNKIALVTGAASGNGKAIVNMSQLVLHLGSKLFVLLGQL